MTRFICISDSHFGAEKSEYNSTGFHIQEGYPEKETELLTALAGYIRKHQVDFVVHAGDVINSSDPEVIRRISESFSTLPVPTYVCLGNHDLTDTKAKGRWLEYAPCFFKGTGVDFSLSFEDCMIHVVPNQWGEGVYEWISDQTASFIPEQKKFIETALSSERDKTHVIVTHKAVHGLDEAQVGQGVNRHIPNESFTEYFSELNRKYHHLRVVISGHTHHNMHAFRNNCHYVTSSAFSEAPFDFKVFTIEGLNIDMYTYSLGNDVSFTYRYDYNKTHSQGRPCDRTFTEETDTDD